VYPLSFCLNFSTESCMQILSACLQCLGKKKKGNSGIKNKKKTQLKILSDARSKAQSALWEDSVCLELIKLNHLIPYHNLP